ncbi:42499_t:CDS:2 [Gigaspora margarita]|uniref:42499_t:CDS:1 n=1 Tax=Gigaspora margarita TaxID=4874 RepID=A0ABN7US91_GIGMA|nr:42499_t:CDS:2 [Gigaspora margarita]
MIPYDFIIYKFDHEFLTKHINRRKLSRDSLERLTIEKENRIFIENYWEVYELITFWYGYYLNEGIGGDKDEKKAIGLFKQAADKNVRGAQLRYAFSFIKNNTLRRKDRPEFIKYLTQAAGKGNYIAQFNLGDLYLNGKLEFQADKEKDNESDFLSENNTLFNGKKRKTQTKPEFNINSEIIVISDSDNNDDLDDGDELPSPETALKNITKFIRYKQINNVELIEIKDDTTAANNNNDDFTYIINNDHFLRISKKTIQSKLKGMVKRLKSKKAIKYIAKICKHKESYKYYNDFKSLSRRQLQDPLAIDRLVPGYYGMKGYMLMYEHLMKTPQCGNQT